MLRYAITDRTQFALKEPECEAEVIRHAGLWADQSVDFIQMREKDLHAGRMAGLAHSIIAALRGRYPAPKLLINSRVDIAIAVGADGVHLTGEPGSLTAKQVRELYAAAGRAEPVVSVSCHTLAEVTAARDAGANFILFGPVFEKRVGGKIVAKGSGLELLGGAVAAASPVPVLALGGVTAENIADCRQAGARGIAAIRLFADDLPTGTANYAP